MLVEQIFRRLTPKATPAQRLTALLHDAPEYVIGDMISPVKASVGPGYEDLDKRLAAAIHIRFGLPAVTASMLKKQIKKADKISAWLEATQLAGFSQTEADRLFGRVDATLTDSLTLHLRAPLEVRQDFTAKHVELLAKM